MTADDIPSLFFVRTRTRENAYTLEQLDRLGINSVSVAEKLAGTFKGWLGVVDDRVVGFCMADSATGELWVLAVLPDDEGRGIGGVSDELGPNNGFGSPAAAGLGSRLTWIQVGVPMASIAIAVGRTGRSPTVSDGWSCSGRRRIEVPSRP